ncbi:MAG: carbohydrate porin [Campylobacterales bacterium]|nr:carbohydrate porin [Campylobacterales bacterium]
MKKILTSFLISCISISPFLFAEDEPFAQENTSAKYQITYNWQEHPSFASPALAPLNNSLNPSSDHMYTFSATAHWGLRLWDNGEIYFNPEVVSGVPFSNALIGMGSYTNGEITRAAGTNLQLYRQRLFLRQTFNLGGETDYIPSGFNQIASTVDKNRLVVTAGNFSTLDVFDHNKYANDPRTQFMNWGNWTYAAYDYAADARGYGWGATAELYYDDWVFRAGRMTGPIEPNLLEVDWQILKHYGDQFEIEHKHTINDLEGKIRLLYWINRAVLASFSDATAYLLANPGTNPQTIFNVRNGVKTKFGIGVNVEQELTDNTGFFLRAMKADGKTETYAFTEVDSSVSMGLLTKGISWNRPNDTVGIALSENRLSNERREYLEAGGISYFIGDGPNFKYKPEESSEIFYSINLMKKIWLTLDYQSILNPAYNSNRGPMNVYAFRIHTEF